MSLEGAVVSLGATGVSLVFAVLVLNQWLSRRKPFQLAWSVGLGMYAVAAATQFFAEAYAWTPEIYRVYYLVAAPLVAVLGAGSVFLLSRRAGYLFVLYTAILFVGFAWLVFTAPVNTEALAQPVPAGEGFAPNVRIWSPLFTVPGSVALVGIAAYSFWKTRMRFSAWIAIGALVVAAGGLLSHLRIPWALYLGEFVGIAVMFWGFLGSVELAKAVRSSPKPTVSP